MAFVYNDKTYRNLQQQVFKNMNDISFILQEEGVLNEFGIKVVGQEASSIDMPTVDDYKEDNPDWAYGDAYAIGTEAPYELYVLTRANGSHPDDYWFNIGEFPAPGPEGPEGPQGEQGVQGQTGPSGQDGITPVIVMLSPSVTTLPAGSDATATVTVGGTIAQPTYKFDFGIPRGQDGSSLTSVAWGDITGSLSNQTDLLSALQGKANASALLSYATQVYADNVANNAQYQAGVYTDSAISALSSVYMTEAAVGDYLTDNQYAHIQDIPTDTSDLTNNAGFITNSALSGYATQSWVSSNFLSIDTPIGGAAQWGSISGTLADQTDLMNKFSEYATVSSLSSYATQSWVASQNYASQTWVNSQIANLSSVYAPIGDYASQADITALSSVYASINALSSYATVSALSDYALASVVSALDYASVGALSSATVIPEVSGTNDGTNWTSLTIDGDTYDIPQGGPSGDYVPVMVETSDENGRYAGEIQNSDSAITLQVTKESDEGNTYTNLGLYQDDAYLTHSWQENIEKENPDYDPEDPDSEPTYTETIDLSNDVYVGSGEIKIIRSYYDYEQEQVDTEEVNLFDLTPVSGVNDGSNWTELTIGSETYSLYTGGGQAQAEWGQISGTLSSQTDLMSKFSEYALASVVASMDYASVGALSSGTSIPTIPSGRSGITLAGGYYGLSDVIPISLSFTSGTSTSFYGHVRFSSNATFMSSVCFGGSAIYNGSTITNGIKLSLPSQSGSLALISDIPSLSGYATESWVSSNFLSSGYVPVISGYAELSASNTFTGINTFSNSLYASQITLAEDGLTSTGCYLSGTASGMNSCSIRLLAGYGDMMSTGTAGIGLTVSPVGTAVSLHANQINLGYPSAIYISGSSYGAETWTFTLSDNTTVSKTILVG